MSYRRVEEILPLEIIKLIQEYVEGENIYIPKKLDNRASWGEKTAIRQETDARNQHIYADYLRGLSVQELAGKYYLSQKSIQRIIRKEKLERAGISS